LWLLEGFGRGRLVCESWEERDAFVLDVDRSRKLTGFGCTLADLEHACLVIGRTTARRV
jgi:hypothetical protein